MKKRIILVGKSASGKDHARRSCNQWFGLNCSISHTTRPPRADESDGVDYFFISKEEFEDAISKDLWYEYTSFNEWYYGTLKEQFHDTSEVFIMTPSGVSSITEEDRKESLIIYFNIDEKIRKHRMYNRKGNADSVERRIIADRKDFESFTDFDVMVKNPTFTIKELFEIVCKYVNTDMSNKIKNQFYGQVYKQ